MLGLVHVCEVAGLVQVLLAGQRVGGKYGVASEAESVVELLESAAGYVQAVLLVVVFV